MPDNETTVIYHQIIMPQNLTSLSEARIVVVPGGTGNIYRSIATTWGAPGTGEKYDTHTDSIGVGAVAVTINKLEALDITAALTGAVAGDLVGITFTRQGGNALDTVDADCYYCGVSLIYN